MGFIAVVLPDIGVIVAGTLSLDVTDFEGVIEVGALDDFSV
jgi:hypothetical protein